VDEGFPIPEIDDAELRQQILKIRGLVAEETIETLRMVRLDHIVNQQGKMVEYDEPAFRAWVIAWLNALETVVCAHLAHLTRETLGGQGAGPIVANPRMLLGQVEDIRRALEIILHDEPEMTPQPITGEHRVLPEEAAATKPRRRKKKNSIQD
jgi:hypothetical protein